MGNCATIEFSIHTYSTMNSLRAARVVLRARPAALKTLQKRGYADAVPDKIKLSLALPHQVRFLPPEDMKPDEPDELDELDEWDECWATLRPLT